MTLWILSVPNYLDSDYGLFLAEPFVGPKNIPRATYFSKTDKELHPKLSQKSFFSFDFIFQRLPVHVIRF